MKLLLLLSAMLSALTSVVGARAPQAPAMAQAAVAAVGGRAAVVRRAARVTPELLAATFPRSTEAAQSPAPAPHAVVPLYANRLRE